MGKGSKFSALPSRLAILFFCTFRKRGNKAPHPPKNQPYKKTEQYSKILPNRKNKIPPCPPFCSTPFSPPFGIGEERRLLFFCDFLPASRSPTSGARTTVFSILCPAASLKTLSPLPRYPIRQPGAASQTSIIANPHTSLGARSGTKLRKSKFSFFLPAPAHRCARPALTYRWLPRCSSWEIAISACASRCSALPLSRPQLPQAMLCAALWRFSNVKIFLHNRDFFTSP